jgi:hypothetical protein
MTRLDLIHELYQDAEPAKRCPLEHDADGCRCRQLTGEAAQLVCDPFSLQLWCLAGREMGGVHPLRRAC